MLIAQITDFHVVSEGKLAYGVIDSRARLEQAVEALLRLDRRPDAVLVTGDLVDRPDPASYAFVARQLARTALPTYVIPGNHDSRAMLLAHFPALPTIGEERYVAYAIEDFPLRLIGLDTTRYGAHLADFFSVRADWLERTLADRPDTPTLLFLHHPPFETGVAAMDFLGTEWSGGLEAVVRRHPQVIRIACGHHHRAITASWAGTVVTAAPGVAHQYPSRFRNDALPALTLEAPGLLLHWWNGRTLASHVMPVDPVPTHEFFAGRPDLWHRMMEALRAGEPIPDMGPVP